MFEIGYVFQEFALRASAEWLPLFPGLLAGPFHELPSKLRRKGYDVLGRPLGNLIFSLMALIRDPIH